MASGGLFVAGEILATVGVVPRLGAGVLAGSGEDGLGHALAACLVRQAGGEPLLPGRAYIAPGGQHLSVERAPAGHFVARLLETPPEQSCRPAADVLFRSVAETGAHALAVVMTGMGEDGLRGCRHLSENGATILVQDEASSVVWGMPGAVARAGLAHAVLPLADLAGEITRRLVFNLSLSA